MSPSKALCVGAVLLSLMGSAAFSQEVGGTTRPERGYEIELVPIGSDRPYERGSGLLGGTSGSSAKMETSYGNCAQPHLPYHWRLGALMVYDGLSRAC